MKQILIYARNWCDKQDDNFFFFLQTKIHEMVICYKEGIGLLHIAAEKGHIKMIEFLLDNGAEIDRKTLVSELDNWMALYVSVIWMNGI